MNLEIITARSTGFLPSNRHQRRNESGHKRSLKFEVFQDDVADRGRKSFKF